MLMPNLNRYSAEWPLIAAIHLKLKYSSQCHRQAVKRGATADIVDAVHRLETPMPSTRPVTRAQSRAVSSTVSYIRGCN